MGIAASVRPSSNAVISVRSSEHSFRRLQLVERSIQSCSTDFSMSQLGFKMGSAQALAYVVSFFF